MLALFVLLVFDVLARVYVWVMIWFGFGDCFIFGAGFWKVCADLCPVNSLTSNDPE